MSDADYNSVENAKFILLSWRMGAVIQASSIHSVRSSGPWTTLGNYNEYQNCNAAIDLRSSIEHNKRTYYSFRIKPNE